MANEVVAKNDFTTSVSEWSNEITKLVARDYESCGVQFDEYSKKCAMSAVETIFSLVKSQGKEMSKLDTSNLRSIVERCASLKLNANAFPRECYFQIRNVKAGNSWVQQIEMGIEGAGNDAILTRGSSAESWRSRCGQRWIAQREAERQHLRKWRRMCAGANGTRQGRACACGRRF